jgi:thiamine-phosphate pyrophosphorylase
MIDANANRAGEGMRVLEDAARLGLGHAGLAARCKTLRHGLRAALAGIGPVELLGGRDTPGDVGTRLTGEGEAARADLRGICIAAAKRMAEALRVLEEMLKLISDGGNASAAIKALRYEGYELEKQIVLALSRPRRQWKLCVLITELLCTHHSWDAVARAALRGGADCLQLREKEMSGKQLLARARALVKIAADTAGPEGRHADVIINDRADVAAASCAAGVHLGQADLPVEAARRVMGPSMIVGVSTSNLEESQKAFDDGADYVGLGPMFPSGTKPKDRIAGVEYVRGFVKWDRARLAENGGEPFPHLAISGIDASRAALLASEGCAGVAVSSVVCSAAEPERVCSEIRAALG